MSLTLNQVVKRIETIALRHRQINSFFFGDVVEYLTFGDITYPVCICDITRGNIDRDGRTTEYNVRLVLCDLADVAMNSKMNELEVQSDLTSIAQDILAMMNYSGYSDSWDIGSNVTMEFMSEKFDDIVMAVSMDIPVFTRYDSNRCWVPTTLTFEKSIDMSSADFRPADYPIKVWRNDTLPIVFEIKVGDTPVDLSGADVRMQVRPSAGSPTLLVNLSEGSGITVQGANNNQINIRSVITIAAGEYYYDLQALFADGTVKTYVTGVFTVYEDVTKP